MATKHRTDAGFTMVEMVVVIIIIGILAAIAIPLYLNQQAKANDAVAQQDITTMAGAIRDALEKEPDLPELTWNERTYLINGVAYGALSPGTVFGGLSGTSMFDWCIDVTHPHGKVAKDVGYKYSAKDGLETGTC